MEALTFPLEDPLIIFSVILFIILFLPLIFNRLNIPGIIGLIFAGMLLGPNALNLLARDQSIILFGTVGIIYIMFLSGLELNLLDFKKQRNRCLIFGFFSFIIPQAAGTIVCYYILNLPVLPSVLIASTFASNTLVTFPIVSKLELTRMEVVTVSVGATMITSILALTVLSVVTAMFGGTLDYIFWVRLSAALIILLLFSFLVIPRLTRWFFQAFEGEGSSQFIFVLAMVFATAFLTEVFNLEAIIGAFLAGLALNRLIPPTSPLMNRLVFVGNTLFVPFFLIGVGMLVDLRILTEGWYSILVIVVLTATACLGKWIPVKIVRRLFKYTRDGGTLMFGLSNGQAVSTLAAVMIGYNIGLVDDTILNGIIFMIVGTCLVASFATEKAGKVLAIREKRKRERARGERENILVPLANPKNMENLIDLALLLKTTGEETPLYALTVISDNPESPEISQQVLEAREVLKKASKHASSSESPFQLVSKVDLNPAAGITKTCREKVITDVVMGWHGSTSARQFVFGSVLDGFIKDFDGTVYVSRIFSPLNLTKTIRVLIPPNAELETGFYAWLRKVTFFAGQLNTPVIFWGSSIVHDTINKYLKEEEITLESTMQEMDDWDDILISLKEVKKGDLLFLISARPGTLSHHPLQGKVPQKLAQYWPENSFIIVYPKQIMQQYRVLFK